MLEVAYRTDKGRVRQENEDALHVDRARALFIVADGMGGHEAGDVAGALTVDYVKQHLEQDVRHPEDMAARLRGTLIGANCRVYETAASMNHLAGMGSTVVVATLVRDMLYVAHVGDSRAYLFDAGTLTLLTEDHTVVSRLLKEGLLSAAESRSDHRRHILTKAIGLTDAVEVDIGVYPYQGQTVMLCTDGLTDMVRDDELAGILRDAPSLDAACDRMVSLANQRGGPDNITVVIFREKPDNEGR